MEKIFSVVEYLHLNGITHRDLKPQNFLFLTKKKNSEIRIIDFGLSKRFNQEDVEPFREIVGTPHYVAPEVLKGRYDSRCDYWSIGVIMYFLLSGRVPFKGSSSKEMF